jgi:hypothetical protein
LMSDFIADHFSQNIIFLRNVNHLCWNNGKRECWNIGMLGRRH